MLTANQTIKHKETVPNDDRPAYLMGTPYTIALDTETTGLDWFDGDLPFIATVSDYDRDYLFDLSSEGDIEDLRLAVSRAGRVLFHNASFDIHMFAAAGVLPYSTWDGKEVHDTEILARLVVPSFDVPNYRLKSLADHFLGAGSSDEQKAIRAAMKSMGLIQREDQKEIPVAAYRDVWLAYPETMAKYAMTDTRYTYDLFHLLLLRLNEHTGRVYALERRVQPLIIAMERRGVALDPAKVALLSVQHQDQLVACMDKLRDWSGNPEFAANSMYDVRDLMEALGIELTETTDDGDIAVNKPALERAAKGATNPLVAEVVETLMEARTHEKFLGTYIQPMLGREYVHPSFRQVGAWTGRQSCTRPNMQNIPVRSGPEVREMFVPRDGHSFVVADYSSIELRLLAYYMNHNGLREIIEQGDPFLWLGEQVFGSPDPTTWPVARGPLKNGFYAMTYGAGGPKFAQTVGGGLTPEDGRDIIKRIKKVLSPNYYDLTRKIEGRVKSVGYVRTLGGRYNYVKWDRAYVGLNALIQGSAADVMKEAMVRASEAVSRWDGHVLLTVHDEIVVEVPTANATLALDDTIAAMNGVAEHFVPGGGLILKASGTVAHNSYAEGK